MRPRYRIVRGPREGVYQLVTMTNRVVDKVILAEITDLDLLMLSLDAQKALRESKKRGSRMAVSETGGTFPAITPEDVE